MSFGCVFLFCFCFWNTQLNPRVQVAEFLGRNELLAVDVLIQVRDRRASRCEGNVFPRQTPGIVLPRNKVSFAGSSTSSEHKRGQLRPLTRGCTRGAMAFGEGCTQRGWRHSGLPVTRLSSSDHSTTSHFVLGAPRTTSHSDLSGPWTTGLSVLAAPRTTGDFHKVLQVRSEREVAPIPRRKKKTVRIPHLWNGRIGAPPVSEACLSVLLRDRSWPCSASIQVPAAVGIRGCPRHLGPLRPVRAVRKGARRIDGTVENHRDENSP